VVQLQEEFQGQEQAFADVVKPGRTQMQEAVLTTLARRAGETGRPVEDLAVEAGWLAREEVEQLLSPEAVCRLGWPEPPPEFEEDLR
jgi:aspartate ammonia-lyase